MAKILAEKLALDLGPESAHQSVFGVCYSILTYDAIIKSKEEENRLTSASWWLKSATKIFENGHATTFLIYTETEDDKENNTKKGEQVVILTGMSYGGWYFEKGPTKSINWARETESSTTSVYYLWVNSGFVQKYLDVRADLEGRENTVPTTLRKKVPAAYDKTTYAAIWPNLPLAKTRYENCVSHAHFLMSKLGLMHWPLTTKGWWIPSIARWVDWYRLSTPFSITNSGWKHKTFARTNTHIPTEAD
jgi:hypothetical protein